MAYEKDSKATAVSGKRYASSIRRNLGIIHDQKFYALRHIIGKSLELPFKDRQFNALLQVSRPLPESVMREIALTLLQNGMRSALCWGTEAEQMTEIIDEIIDEREFSLEGRTAYATLHEDESLTEVIEYFILPNDLADTGLLVVIADETEFKNTVMAFGQTVKGLREVIYNQTV